MLLESILCASAILLCIDSIQRCCLPRSSTEWIPIMIPSTIYSNSLDIDQIAPLTEEISEESCSICLESFQTIRYKRKTRCGHVFCSECLHEWFRKKQTCPLCNQSLNSGGPFGVSI